MFKLSITPSLLQSFIYNYEGDVQTFEKAIALIIMADQFGTKAVRISHDKSTIRKLEKVIGLQLSVHYYPEMDENWRFNRLIEIQENKLNFWKCVSSEIKLNSSNKIESSREDGET